MQQCLISICLSSSKRKANLCACQQRHLTHLYTSLSLSINTSGSTKTKIEHAMAKLCAVGIHDFGQHESICKTEYQQPTPYRPQHGTTQHSTAWHSTAQHNTAQRSAAQHSHSPAQHSTAQHSTAQHSTAQHSTAQHSRAEQSRAEQSRQRLTSRS